MPEMTKDDLATQYLFTLASLELAPGARVVADTGNPDAPRRIATVLGAWDAAYEGVLRDVVDKNEVLVRVKPVGSEKRDVLLGVPASRTLSCPSSLRD